MKNSNLDSKSKKDSLFILGAGASVDHGYPTGLHLLEDIVNILEEAVPLISEKVCNSLKTNNKTLLAILLCLNDTADSKSKVERKCFDDYLDLIETFYRRLKYSTPRSIDDFIHNHTQSVEEENKSKVEKLGKLLIVLRILHYENKSIFYNTTCNPEDPTYIRLHGKNNAVQKLAVYKQVATFFTAFWQNLYGMGYADFIHNLSKTRFITFNYDRLLEHFIYNTAKNFFNPDDKNLEKDILSFFTNNVTHIYGRLPELDWENENGMGYGKVSFQPLIYFLDDTIKTIQNSGIVRSGNQEKDPHYFFWRVYEEMATILLNTKSTTHQKFNYECLMFIFKAIDEIRTYTESVRGNHPKIVDTFDHLYFLGFSFHELNVEVIDELLNFKVVLESGDGSPPDMYSSIYGMKKQEVANAEKLLIKKLLHRKGDKDGSVQLISNFENAEHLKIHEFFKSVPEVRFIRK